MGCEKVPVKKKERIAVINMANGLYILIVFKKECCGFAYSIGERQRRNKVTNGIV